MEASHQKRTTTIEDCMVPSNSRETLQSSATFRGIRLGINHRSVVARLINTWFEFREAYIWKKRTLHMLWLDRKEQMIECYVEEEDIEEIYGKLQLGHLYKLDDLVAVPAKTKGRVVPRELQLMMKANQLISHVEEDEDSPEDPVDLYPAAFFSMVPMQKNNYDCHGDITGCIRRVTVPETVQGTLKEFIVIMEDVSGAKAIVNYRGWDIIEYLKIAPTVESHLPLITTITNVMSLPPPDNQKYQYRFVSTAASHLIIRSYKDASKAIMNIFFPRRKPVTYFDPITKEKIGYLHSEQPPKKTLSEIKSELGGQPTAQKILYRCKFTIPQVWYRRSICRTTQERPEPHYEIQAMLRDDSGEVEVIMDHEAALSIICMSPGRYRKLEKETIKTMIGKNCAEVFAGQLYIGWPNMNSTDPPARIQIRVATLWNTSAFDK